MGTVALVVYNNADGLVVVAAEMHRGNSSYHGRYGYQRSKEIVCIDCKEDDAKSLCSSTAGRALDPAYTITANN